MKFLLSENLSQLKKGEVAICVDRLLYVKHEENGSLTSIPLKNFNTIPIKDRQILVTFLNEAFKDLKGIHTVVFNDMGNLTYVTVTNLNKVSTIVPSAKVGLTFVEWQQEGKSSAFDFNKAITEDITLVAKYSVSKYTVKFVDYDDSDIDEQEIEHGADAVAPENPTREGYIFTGWDKEFTNITGALTVKAQYEEEQAPEPEEE